MRASPLVVAAVRAGPSSLSMRSRRGRFRTQQAVTRGSRMEWVLLAIVVAVVLYAVVVYNGLVSLRQRVTQAFADIDVQLKQRHDLIPNLVETVKGYAAHERGTLEAVVQASNAALSASRPAQQAAAEGALSGAPRRLTALSQ